MFQYAAGRAKAVETRQSLKLDLSWYRGADRLFELHSFSIDPQVQTIGTFRTAIIRLFGTEFLDSYFEDKRYALSMHELLKKEFSLRQPSKTFTDLLSSLGTESVGIHIRRGDFLKATGKVVLNRDYYEHAIEHIKKTSSPTRILVFSDDKAWCQLEFASIGGIRADVVRGISDPEELILLSKCTHIVTADSTFSWWAAFLSNDKSSVIAPARWYQDKAKNAATLDALILPGWTVLE